MKKQDLVSRIEKKVYFKIARGVVWFFSAICVLSVLVLTMLTIKTSLSLIGTSTSVSVNEVKAALEKTYVKEKSTSSESAPIDFRKTSEEEKLDKELEELINVLNVIPAYKDDVKRAAKNYLSSHWDDVKDQILVVREAKELIKKFPEEQRARALDEFFQIKIEKENAKKAAKAKAYAKLEIYVVGIISLIWTLTLISMVLVLLAIERNTRKTEEV